jgi:hypothetical protein
VPAQKGTVVPKGSEVASQSETLEDGLKTEISPAAAETGHDNKPSQTGQQKSDATLKVSPRSQAPNKKKNSSKKVDLVSDDQQPKGNAVNKELEVLQRSSPVSDKERPGLLNRTSDSDHVDESFHTASATPPADKSLQALAASSSHEKPASTAKENISSAHVEKKMKKGGTANSPVPLKKTTPISPIS